MKTADFKRSDKVWFYNLGIGDKKDYIHPTNNWTMSNLKDIRADLNHTSVSTRIFTEIKNNTVET